MELYSQEDTPWCSEKGTPFPNKNDFESTKNCQNVPFFSIDYPWHWVLYRFLALIVHEIDVFSDEPEEMLLKGS